jgi:Lon protease-like protein
MESIRAVVAGSLPLADGPLRLTEIWGTSCPDTQLSSGRRTSRNQTSIGGRLLATYAMAAAGLLDYRAEVGYEDTSGLLEEHQEADISLLSQLQETAQKELDCHVCYNLMHDPVTAPCGHTFCRICLTRVLDHSMSCPVCRRNLPIPPSLTRQASNLRLVSLLQSLYPEMVSARAAAIASEEQGGIGELDTPLFVCTLAFPGQPTFLHIFEPRYRLMIRRAYNSNQQFGVMMYNQTGENQGDLGSVHFKAYGVMLQILNIHMFPDGRSLIETRGMYRFKVLNHGTLDEYVVGRVQRVEDLSLVEEEQLEADEIAAASPSGAGVTTGLDAQSAPTMHAEASNQFVNVDCLSTQQMLTLALNFITKMQAHSAPWLHQRILQSHGGPPSDAASFPYWFASIIPIVDEEKYQLLRTSSVRERLKIVVGWIRRIENQRW